MDDMEASKFTNVASIRVSMGTSQTTCDGEDFRSKVKSLITLYVEHSWSRLGSMYEWILLKMFISRQHCIYIYRLLLLNSHKDSCRLSQCFVCYALVQFGSFIAKIIFISSDMFHFSDLFTMQLTA